MWDVFQMTRRYDSLAVWYLLVGTLLPIVVGVALGVFIGGGPVGMILYIVAGVMGGILLFLIILGRRAEKAAFSQIAGQPGAVGSVLKTSLRGGWQASEMPVAMSPKTYDAVYRAIGRGGIVLIGEGPKSRTQRMLDDERRAVARILPNVPVHLVRVGPDADSVPLYKLAGSFRRYKSALRKSEVIAISKRLASLEKSPVPIPKGMDPMKARAQRPR
jgi:hypothetical protein